MAVPRAVKSWYLLRLRKNTVIQHSVILCCTLLKICTYVVPLSIEPECLWGMARITLLFRQEREQSFLHLKHSQHYCKVGRTSCSTRAVPKTQREIVSLCCRKFIPAFKTAKLLVCLLSGGRCFLQQRAANGMWSARSGVFSGSDFFFGSWCTWLFLGGPWALWPGLTLLSWEHS